MGRPKNKPDFNAEKLLDEILKNVLKEYEGLEQTIAESRWKTCLWCSEGARRGPGVQTFQSEEVIDHGWHEIQKRNLCE